MNILDTIIASKVKQIASDAENTPVSELEKSKFFSRDIVPLTDYILDRGKTGIIAEFKRKSPSKGMINPDADVEKVTRGYEGKGKWDSGCIMARKEKIRRSTKTDA